MKYKVEIEHRLTDEFNEHFCTVGFDGECYYVKYLNNQPTTHELRIVVDYVEKLNGKVK